MLNSPTTKTTFKVLPTNWAQHAEPLRAIRETVFVQEQNVPLALEWDGEDADALHVLAVAADGTPIGCGRLLRNGHIGRMAVLADWRRQGVGAGLLKELLELARRHALGPVFLNAQSSAVGFYQRFGFVAEGEPFMEAGILHQGMRLASDPNNSR
jgi:predicted GNAT family N-acyltransferase